MKPPYRERVSNQKQPEKLSAQKYQPETGQPGNHSHCSCKYNHQARNQIFSRMMPQIALQLPAADRIVPLQKDRADGALHGKAESRQNGQACDVPILQLQTNQINYIRRHVAAKKKQAVGQTDAKKYIFTKPPAESIIIPGNEVLPWET